MGCRQSRAAMIADPLFFADDGIGGGGDGSISASSSHQPQLVVRAHRHHHHRHHHHHHATTLPALAAAAATAAAATTSPATASSTTISSLPSSTRNLRRRRRLYEAQLREEARTAEIVALQQSLAAMEDFFQSLLGQSHLFQEAMDPNNNWTTTGGNHNSGPPPASQEFIQKRLPALTTFKEGTLCGVCGDEIVSCCEATKLPCGHVFHQTSCIQPWLERHCTCPVCRYEAPTDDASYETGRLERMSMRQLPVEEDDFDDEETTTTTNATQNQQQDVNQQQQEGQEEKVEATAASSSDDDDDDDEQDDDILDDAIPSFAMNNFTTDVYDADESGTEEASLKPSSSGTCFPKAPHQSNGASHYDADESSLETVDFGGGAFRVPLAAAAATGAGHSTDDSA